MKCNQQFSVFCFSEIPSKLNITIGVITTADESDFCLFLIFTRNVKVVLYLT